MPKYDPRYIYPRGYEYGNVALGLADLLGQGFDRMHKWDQDTQAQGNRDQEYLMKLQQFMQQNEDRTLDRGLKQQTADLQGKQLEALLAKQKSDAEIAASKRSGMGKIGSVNPFETTSTPVGQPVETPVGPAEPPTFLQRLAQTRTPITMSQAMQKANLTPDELNSGLDYTALGHLFPGPKEPKTPEVKSFDPTHDVYEGTKLIRPGTPKVSETKPFYEGKSPTELAIVIADPTTPTDQKKIAQDALDGIRAAELDKAKNTGAIAAANQAAGENRRDTTARQKKADEMMLQLGGAENAVGLLSRLSDKVNNVGGVLGRAKGLTINQGKAFLQSDPNMTLMEDTGKEFASIMARVLTSDVGNLAEGDVNRALAAVPRIGDNKEVAAQKKAILKNALGKIRLRVAAYAKGDPIPDDAELEKLVGGQAQAGDSGGRIRVRRKGDGATGSILEQDFDPSRYDRVN